MKITNYQLPITNEKPNDKHLEIWAMFVNWKLKIGNWKLHARRKTLNTQAGSVLLLTLLLLALFLFIGLAWSTIVLRGLKIVERADEAVVAFAAAESGIEDGLYRLKTKDRLGKQDTLMNGASWDENSYNQVDVKVIDTLDAVTSPAIIDLFNPNVADVLSAKLKELEFGAESMQIVWEGSLSITANLMQWDGINLTSLSKVSIGNGQIIDIAGTNVYRLLLTTSTPVKNIRITATKKDNGNGAPVPIPTALSIESNGFYRSATQAVRMRFPLESPIP